MLAAGAAGTAAPLPGGIYPHPCVPTGVRDYIHVVDLAKGHLAALRKLKENCGCKVPQELLAGLGWTRTRLVQPQGS